MAKEKLLNKCKYIKLKTLELAAATGKNGAHIGGALSAVELLVALLEVADFNKTGSRDRIILSKGHGALALYGALWQNGFMSEEELAGFDRNGTGLFGHPHRNPAKGLDFSAGSLGLGLSYAVGIALAFKKKESPNRVFAIVGDGECNEGIIWEALMAASNFNLSNLVVIVDSNGWQLDGPTNEIMDTSDLETKFKAFGFETSSINGHDLEEIISTLKKSKNSKKPFAIIANTVKGNGISFLTDTKDSHFCTLPPKKLEQAIQEINSAY